MIEEKIKSYEISFLANASEDAGIVQKLILSLKGEILNEGPVSEIRLAYPIDKKSSAFFGYIHFKLTTDAIQELTKTLGFEKSVLRSLVITPIPLKPIPRKLDSVRTSKRGVSNDLSNEALEEKLAALQK